VVHRWLTITTVAHARKTGPACQHCVELGLTDNRFFVTMEKQQLYEFPVLIKETNEIITLFLNKNDMEKASQANINILP